MQVKSTATEIATINKMFNDMNELFSNLYARYLDEAGNESLDAYADVIKRELPLGITLIEMIKRPFGFTFHIGTNATYHMIHTHNSISWGRK